MSQGQMLRILNEESRAGDTVVSAAGTPVGDLLAMWDQLKPMARVLVRKAATYKAVDERREEEVAVVIFSDTPTGAKMPAGYRLLLLAHRSRGWGIFLDQPNPKRFTHDELVSMRAMLDWARDRAMQLGAADAAGVPAPPSSAPTTAPAP